MAFNTIEDYIPLRGLLLAFFALSASNISTASAMEHELAMTDIAQDEAVFGHILAQVIAKNAPIDTPEKIIGTIKELCKLRRVCRSFRDRLNVECIGRILQSTGVDVNTALHWAVRNGRAEYLNALIAVGANVHTADKRGQTALHLAAWYGRVRCLQLLLAAGGRANDVDGKGVTALHWATSCENTACLNTLLAAGADVNGTDRSGDTALHWSISCENTECLGTLLAAGAIVNAANLDGRTALDMAIKNGKTEAAQILLSYYIENRMEIPAKLRPALHKLGVTIKHAQCSIQ